ncbi:MAG: hypothetical protein WA956_06540 [Stenotrophomonas sp.]
MNKNPIIAGLFLTLAIGGCARREEAEASAEATITEVATKSTQEEIERQVPAATIAPVTVRISLSPQARSALKSKSEKVLVMATYFGDPRSTEQARKLADASGTIKLGENKQTIDGSDSVTFQEDVIDKSRLGFTLGEVQLTINVTSSKTATPENLLACPFYWETLAEASRQPVNVECKAISEVEQ